MTHNFHRFLVLCNYWCVLTVGCSWVQAVRKLTDAKKLESNAHYNTDFGKD
jgi:hypothetical protein